MRKQHGACMHVHVQAGETCLICACRTFGKPEIVRALLVAGADPNAKDKVRHRSYSHAPRCTCLS